MPRRNITNDDLARLTGYDAASGGLRKLFFDANNSEITGQFEWLKSGINELVWTVTADDDINNEDTIDLDFNTKLGDYGRLSDPKHHEMLLSIKALLILQRQKMTNQVTFAGSGDQQSQYLRLYVAIYHWFLMSRLTKLDYVTDYHIDELKQTVVEGRLHTGLFDSALTTYVDQMIADNIMPATYKKGSYELLDTKKIASLLNCSAGKLKNQLAVYHLDRLRIHFDISKKDTELKTDIPSFNPKYQTLFLFSHALTNLYSIGQIDETLHHLYVHPFGKVNATDWAKINGERGTRTRNIPVEMAFKLIRESANFVLDNGQFLAEAGLLLEKAESMSAIDLGAEKEDVCSEHKKRLEWEWLKPKLEKLKTSIEEPESEPDEEKIKCIELNSHIDLYDALKLLWGAGSIIILAFTARRDTEVKRLSVDCLTTANGYLNFGELDEGSTLIRAYVAKTKKKYDVFPTNELLTKTINILIRAGDSSRKRLGSNYVFCRRDPHSREDIRVSNFAKLINKFAEYADCKTLPDGTEHNYACHQFRRFFAIVYYWRYGAQDIYTLSKMLGHFSIEMTKTYITEISGSAMFDEEEKRFLSDYMKRHLLHGKALGGQFGKNIEQFKRKAIDAIKAKLNIVQEHQVADELEQMIDMFVETQDLKVEFHGTHMCVGKTPARKHLSKCIPPEKRQLGYSPDLQAADEEICDACPNKLCGEESLINQKSRLKQATLAEKSESPIIKANAQKAKERAQKMIEVLEVADV